MTQIPWKKLSSKIVHQNPWYKIRRDEVITPLGNHGQFYLADHPDAVYIMALDDEQNVYLVNMYRYPTQMFSLELPAGNTDGEDPLDAAKRELQEETGLRASKWDYLGKIQAANGFLNTFCHLYIATGLTETGQNKQQEEGISGIRKVPLAKAWQMATNGEITDSQSICLLAIGSKKLGVI